MMADRWREETRSLVVQDSAAGGPFSQMGEAAVQLEVRWEADEKQLLTFRLV